MKKLCFLAVCLTFTGCALFSGAHTKRQAESVKIAEPSSVKLTVRADSDRLWKAAVIELRRGSILNSDRDRGYLKAVIDNKIVEFKIESETKEGKYKESLFTVKAYSIENIYDKKKAVLISRRIYKRASPGWFF